jgi:hypothetical protein
MQVKSKTMQSTMKAKKRVHSPHRRRVKAQRQDHDQLFKRLLQLFFADFVTAFLPGAAKYLDRRSVQFLDKEIFVSPQRGERHEVDLVARCRFKGQAAYFLVHLEHQARQQAEFGRRMFEYFALLFQRHGLPVYPVAVFSHDRAVAEPEVFGLGLPDLQVLEFRFRVVQLSRLSWRDYLKHRNPVVCALMAKMGVRPADRVRVKLECLRMLVTLKVDKARQHFLSAFIDNYLRLTAKEALQFEQASHTLLASRERKKVMQLTTSWKEEGRQEGRQEGLYGIIRRQLARRCGSLPTQVEAKIKRLSAAKLEALAEALLDFKSSEDLEAWLHRNG